MPKRPTKARSYRSDDTWYGGTYGAYEELAQYLNAHGIGAIGHDTLGHGKVRD